MFFPLEIVSIFLVICSSTFNNEINLNVNKALNISRVKFSYLNKPNWHRNINHKFSKILDLKVTFYSYPRAEFQEIIKKKLR